MEPGIIFPTVLFQAGRNGDQMTAQTKDGKKNIAPHDTPAMRLLTQRSALQCRHFGDTQNKTQKIDKINPATGCSLDQVFPGIHAAPQLFVGK